LDHDINPGIKTFWNLDIDELLRIKSHAVAQLPLVFL
jgi:hypothetical protein